MTVLFPSFFFLILTSEDIHSGVQFRFLRRRPCRNQFYHDGSCGGSGGGAGIIIRVIVKMIIIIFFTAIIISTMIIISNVITLLH